MPDLTAPKFVLKYLIKTYVAKFVFWLVPI